MEKFGERLRFLRVEKGLSQRQLAQILQIGKASVSSWKEMLKNLWLAVL
jgi:transcriptional regulator with XRE-family HTH domain